MEGRSTSLRTKNVARDISESLGKLPPQDLDAEAAVLGVCMLHKHSLDEVLSLLQPEDFYKEQHKEMMTAFIQLTADSMPVDMRSVRSQLSKNGKLEIVGGPYYLAELTSGVNGGENLKHDCIVIKEMALRREMIQMASKIHQDAYEDSSDVFELLEGMQKFVNTVNAYGGKGRSAVTLREGMAALALHLQTKREGDLPGIDAGFRKLNRLLGGWMASDLIIIAARPGMGKTTFVLNTLSFITVILNIPAAIFSLEMAILQLVSKLSAQEGIELRKIRNGKLEPPDWDAFLHKTAKLSPAPLFMDDTSSISIMELEIRCRRLVYEHGVKLIVVDYLQLMRGEKERGGSREGEIASISRGLKRIAKDLNVPVIALSQLSRKVEERGGDKRPILADLRESGAIEQDADTVIFLWRPEVYKITSYDGHNFYPGETRLIVAKHRNGSIGEVDIQFLGSISKFQDYDQSAAKVEALVSEMGGNFKPLHPPKPPEPESDEPPF